MRMRRLGKMRMTIRAKIGWLGGLVLLLAAACVPLLNSEIRSFLLFKTAPGYARDAHFLRLTGNSQAVYLLGTIHRDHLTSETYSLWHIQSVVENLKPDLLLVESRPEELTRENWADGPIEMPVASLTARSLGIPVAGIDWWRKMGSKPGTSSPERDDHMCQNALDRLPGHRNVLILVGYSHVAELRQRLQRAGYAVDRFDRQEKCELLSTRGGPATFPPGLKRAVRKYIEGARKELDKETDPDWRSAFEVNIAVREKLLDLIEKVGERSS
jgi:hypothetical protein